MADLGGVQLVNPPFGRQLYIFKDTCRPALIGKYSSTSYIGMNNS